MGRGWERDRRGRGWERDRMGRGVTLKWGSVTWEGVGGEDEREGIGGAREAANLAALS